MDNVYEVKIEDEVLVASAIQDIVDVICQKEKFAMNEIDMDKMLLCVRSTGAVLNPKFTIRECGVKSGDTLILV